MTQALSIPHYQKTFLLKALNTSGSIEGAAKLLGVCPRTVVRWMEKYRVIRVTAYKEKESLTIKNQ